MESKHLALAVLGIASALWSGTVSYAAAQGGMPNPAPLYGTIVIRPGFSANLRLQVGVAGGPVALSAVDSRCRGYAQPNPNHVVVAEGSFPYLAIMVHASHDTTLLVQTPDGRVYCNDDTDGLDPRVEISTDPGPVRIWVGSYSSNQSASYTLGVSESPAVRSAQLENPGAVAVGAPPSSTSGISPLGAPVYGQLVLRTGFRPDPQLLTGVAGGAVPANTLVSSCRGWVTPQPSHVVRAGSAFANLRFVVAADHDTTLLVQYPNGRIVCDDDSGGSLNPLVEGPTGPGEIRIWVGSYSEGRSGPYALAVTENPALTHAMLGAVSQGGLPPTLPPSTSTSPPPPPTDLRPPTQPSLQPPPPSASAVRVDLQPRIPVTLFGPGMTTATVAVWSPRGGPRIEIGVTPSGDLLTVNAGVAGQSVRIVTVPPDIARDGLVTVTQRPDQRLLVRAERSPDATDPGAQFLLLVRWDPARGAPVVAEQWLGTYRSRVPRWAR
jgi:hypothetical protein